MDCPTCGEPVRAECSSCTWTDETRVAELEAMCARLVERRVELRAERDALREGLDWATKQLGRAPELEPDSLRWVQAHTDTSKRA